MIRVYAVIILPHFFLQIYKKVLDSMQKLWYYIGIGGTRNESSFNER